MSKLRQVLKVFLLLLFLLVLFGYALIFNNRAGWVAVSFLLIFLLIDLLSILPWLRWLTIGCQGKIWTEVGQTFQINLTLKSRWLFLIPLVKISLPEISQNIQAFNWYLGQKRNLFFPAQATTRGITEKVTVLFEASDLFGFFNKKFSREIPLEIITMPAKQGHASTMAKKIIQQQQLSSFGEANTNIKGFRSYRPGDAFKKVDWKISARTQELIVREYEQTKKSELTLIFWGVEGPEFERMLSYFYSLVQILQTSQGIETILVGEQVTLGSEIGEKYASLKPIQKPVTLPKIKGRQVLIFTSKLADPLLQGQMTVLRQTNQVTVYDVSEIQINREKQVGGDSQ